MAISISQRDSGGVCDCGDPEAWVRSFPCKYYSVPQGKNKEIPHEAAEVLRKTVDACLDYIIDVFNSADLGVHKFKIARQVTENHELSKLSEYSYGQADNIDNGKYVLSMWNDNKHSFSDALEAITLTTHKAGDFGKMVVERIDSQGRAMVEVGRNLSQMMSHKASMERTGLYNTVRSSVDFMREEMCECIAHWIDDLQRACLNGDHEFTRHIIGSSLLDTWQYGTEALVSENWNVSEVAYFSDYIRRSKLHGPYIPDLSWEKYQKEQRFLLIANDDLADSEEDVEMLATAGQAGAIEVEGNVIDLMPSEGDEENADFGPYGDDSTDEDGSAQKSHIVQSSSIAEGATEGPGSLPPYYDLKSYQEFCSRPTVAPMEGFWKEDEDVLERKNRALTTLSSRVQYLMFFDVRFWKNLRLTMRDIFISVLISTPEFKKTLGLQYSQIYPHLSELYMIIDREPEYSIIGSMSTQLFTTPTIATDMVENSAVTDFLAALYTFFTKGKIGPPSEVNTSDHVSSDLKVLKNHRFSQIFHDIEYIVSRSADPSRVSSNLKNVSQVCDFTLLFQGLSPMQRQQHTHVEYESDQWIYFFNMIPYFLQLGFAVAKGIAPCPSEKALQVIARISRIISDWSQGAYSKRLAGSEMSDGVQKFKMVSVGYEDGYNSKELIVDFNVENEKVSVHHPVHAFLSWIIQYGKVDSIEVLRKALIPDNCVPGAEVENLELIFDHPIRVLSLLSQIQVGLWVRNGYSLRNQLYHYRDATLRDSGFLRDVFMVQTALVVLPPEAGFLTLLDRWALIDWKESKLYDDTQRMYLMEDFIHYLIAFIVERNHLRGLDEKEVKRRYICKEIIQCLAVKDLSFSEICKTIPDILSSDEMFEVVLKEMAIFKPPTGLRDKGVYQLRREYLTQFDSHYIHFSSANIEESEVAVKKQISLLKNISAKAVVLEPPFEAIESGPFMNIGGFTRTRSFAKFIQELMHFVFTNNSGTQYDGVMNHILQLIHAACLDDILAQNILNIDFDNSFCKLLLLEPVGDSEYSILDLLHMVKNSLEFKDSAAKVDRIVEILKQRNSEAVSEALERAKLKVPLGESSLGAENYREGSADGQNLRDDGESEVNRRKRLGQHHRERVFEEMRKQQRIFAAQNIEAEAAEEATDDDADMEEDTGPGEGNAVFPKSTCILCRMPDDKTSVFGIMCYIMKSNAVRRVPWDHKDWVYEAYGTNRDLDDKITDETYEESGSEKWKTYRKEFRERNSIGPGFPSVDQSQHVVVSGCGHGIHFQCYREHVHATVARATQVNRNTPEDATSGEYLCPLCKALNNTFIPILWRHNYHTLEEVMKVNEYGEAEYPENMSDDSFKERLTDLHLSDPNYPFGRNEGPSASSDAIHNLSKSLTRNLLPHYEKVFKDIDEQTASSYEGLASQMRASLRNTRLVISGFTASRSNSGTIDTDDRTVNPFISFGKDHSLMFLKLLWLSNTIHDLEASLRGLQHPNKMGGLLIDQIPTQTLQILRVFGEYCKAYISFSLRNDGTLLSNPLVSPIDLFFPAGDRPMPFRDFVLSSVITGPALGFEVPEVLRISYVSMILQSLTGIADQVNKSSTWVDSLIFELPKAPGCDDVELLNSLSKIASAVRTVVEQDFSSPKTWLWNNAKFGETVYSMIARQVLPFLRQSAIFVYLMVGSGYDAYNYMGYEKGYEGDKLCDFLGMPHLTDMIHKMAQEGSPENIIMQRYMSYDKVPYSRDLDYPGVMRLLHLPKRLDEFFNVSKREGTVSEMPNDPAVCLFCGEVRGIQAPSPDDGSLGQCFSHTRVCAGKLAMFFLPKRSSILLLNGDQGSFAEGPYLDSHGEPDETMRSGRPQFLQEVRYDHFTRTKWLQHEAVSFIARRLDSFIDNGGWETL